MSPDLAFKSVDGADAEADQLGGFDDASALTHFVLLARHTSDQGIDLRTMQDYLGHRDPKGCRAQVRRPVEVGWR